MRVAVLAAMSLTIFACTSEPLVFPDWTIPVPEGTRVIEYAAVPMEERTEWIEMVEDLVIGQRSDDSNYRFFQAMDLAIDSAGGIYVLEAGNLRVQVFDQDGNFDRTIGRRGQGPGELTRPYHIAVAGERLIVSDWGKRRLSTWDLVGAHQSDLSMPFNGNPFGILGFSDGSMILKYAERSGDPGQRGSNGVIARFSDDGQETQRYAIGPGPRSEAVNYSGRTAALNHIVPEVAAAIGPADELYFSTADEYQVMSVSPEGRLKWAMRVAWPAAPFPQARIDDAIGSIRKVFPEAEATDFEWPARLPVIGSLRVDGHGHLYVFPYVSEDQIEEAQGRPVDVYSTDGARLFSGMIPRGWREAQSDHVYVLEEDPTSSEQVVVRYRLVEPF